MALFCDPGGYIIEAEEDRKTAERRFPASGMTMEEASVRIDVSVADMERLLTAE